MYNGTKADSSDEEPEEEICFQLKNETSRDVNKKIGGISLSEDEDSPTFTKKQKRLIEIGDDSD